MKGVHNLELWFDDIPNLYLTTNSQTDLDRMIVYVDDNGRNYFVSYNTLMQSMQEDYVNLHIKTPPMWEWMPDYVDVSFPVFMRKNVMTYVLDSVSLADYNQEHKVA